jgi:hypothetical protein
MRSEPRKIVLTSLAVGAVAVAAYVSQSDTRWLAADESSLDRDSGPAHRIRGDTMTGSVSSGGVAARNGSIGGSAQDLQAARNSRQRNDLAAVQAQQDALPAVRRDDAQVLAPQGEVAARSYRAPASVQAEKSTQRGEKPVRVSPLSTKKAGRAQKNYGVTPEYSNHVPAATQAIQVPRGMTATQRIEASTDHAPVLQTAPTAQAVPVPAPAPVSVSAPPPSPSAPSPQLTFASDTPLKSDSGPKTRAEVRAEIARARADGSLPAFGNPDPSGPGGAPSMTAAPRP